MISKCYKLKLTKEQTGTYVPIDVEVPSGIERMELKYSFTPEKVPGAPKTWKNEIDLVVLNEKGEDVGTRGGAVREVIISPYYSIPGYDRVKINPGIWKAVIGVGRMLGDGVELTLTVNLLPKVRRWYAGDTHCHSHNSDGKHPYHVLVERARKNGLEFLFMTDHNRSVVGELPCVDGLTMVNGLEVTNAKGHANLWGVKKPFEKTFIINTYEDWLARREEAEGKGAVICLNHPLCTKCPWLFPFEGFHYDAIEVWNGPMRLDNQKCVDWYHELLVSGKRPAMVGGSDYHVDYVVTNLLGNPTTYVLSEGREQEDILKAIKEGRTTICNRAGDTFIDLSSGSAVVGDTVAFDGTQKIKVSVKKLRRGHVLFVKDAEGIMYEYKAKSTGDFEVELPVRGKGFVRAEVKNQLRGLHKFIFDIVMSFMIPEQAFKKIPPMVYAACSPIYFE